LVLQTILPALMLAEAPSTLILEGGTHNPFAPPYDFLARAYLPLLAQMGPQVKADLERPGFYPAGGGKLSVTICPQPELQPLTLLDRGEITGRRVWAVVARLPRHIAERECQTIAQQSGWDEASFVVREVSHAAGPGNVVLIEMQTPHVTEVFTGFGEKGVRAEEIASRTWSEAARYLTANVPVGQHLADQLLLPLGLGAYQGTGGGVFRTLALSRHSTTHIEILRQFLGVAVHVEQHGGDEVTIRVG
jgi:RNA 3'-terminal phosphate cyclase (ATP)